MFSRQQAFREAISCDVYAGYGTPYPCSDRDIYDTQQYSGDNERPFVSASQANDELIDHNDLRRPPLPHERDAIRRLVSALDDAGREPWHADLVIKAFLDLDIVLFGGVLRGNVCVAWGDPDEWLDIEAISGLDVNDTLGVTYKTQPGRAQILLNAEVTFLSPDTLKPFYSMFTTLLHEMCVSDINLRVGRVSSNCERRLTRDSTLSKPSMSDPKNGPQCVNGTV